MPAVRVERRCAGSCSRTPYSVCGMLPLTIYEHISLTETIQNGASYLNLYQPSPKGKLCFMLYTSLKKWRNGA